MCCCFGSIFAGERKPPPASKQAVKELPTIKTTAEQEGCLSLQFPIILMLIISVVYYYMRRYET